MLFEKGEKYIVRYINKENPIKYGSIFLVTPNLRDMGYLEVIDTIEGSPMRNIKEMNVILIGVADDVLESDMEFDRYINRLGT